MAEPLGHCVIHGDYWTEDCLRCHPPRPSMPEPERTEAATRVALPERTVEAAACGAFWQDDIGGHIRGSWTWGTIPDVGRANYRAMVRAAFAAAMAPTLGPDRLVVAGEYEREVRADQTRRIVEWLRSAAGSMASVDACSATWAVATGIEREFGGDDA